jgi:hypothetical protein
MSARNQPICKDTVTNLNALPRQRQRRGRSGHRQDKPRLSGYAAKRRGGDPEVSTSLHSILVSVCAWGVDFVSCEKKASSSMQQQHELDHLAHSSALWFCCGGPRPLVPRQTTVPSYISASLHAYVVGATVNARRDQRGIIEALVPLCMARDVAKCAVHGAVVLVVGARHSCSIITCILRYICA